MQQTATFGRRGLVASPPPPPRLQAQAQVQAPEAGHAGDVSWLARAPILTGALLLVLTLVFLGEQAAAFGGAGPAGLGYRSLIALGGVNGQLVLRSGEAWRVFTAPLLHASVSHLVGNGVVLLLVGWRLEALLGRAWFAAIFAVSGLGGALVSFILNPDGPVSVGASGAIMGLLGAAFVCSLHVAAFEHASRMRRLSVRLIVPALIPFSGHVDYSGHAGGVVTGAVLGLWLHAVWPEMQERPNFARPAAWIAAALGGLAVVAFGLVALRYPAYAARDALFMPDSEIPHGAAIDRTAIGLEARYPQDPRAHMLAALADMDQSRLTAAEAELRTGLSLQARGEADLPPHGADAMTPMLAVVLMMEGRKAEATAEARPYCDGSRHALSPALTASLRRTGVCGDG